MTAQGPNTDLPSAAELARRDPSLHLPDHADPGVRTSDQAPPRRPPAPEPEKAAPDVNAEAAPEGPEATVTAEPEPSAPVEPPRSAPPTAQRPGVPHPPPEPPVWAAAPTAAPPSGPAVWGPPPTAQPPFPPHEAVEPPAGPPTPDSAVPRLEAVPGDPGALAFTRGEAPPAPEPPRPETSADLTTDRLTITHTAERPASPLRRVWNRLTGRQMAQVEPEDEVWRRAMRAGATTRTLTPRRIAVLCIKGGVGKTTTTFLLGATLASLRGDRVIAVDANTDQGTLAGRLRTQTSKNIQHLLRKEEVRGYYDVRELTSQSPTGLEVLASNEDPGVTAALTAADYGRVIDILEQSYSVILSDCGTGILHDVIRGEGGVLDNTDQLIVVSNTSVNGAKKAAETMDWLEQNGHRDLVRNSVSVINMVGEGSQTQLDLAQMRAHFASRSKAVVEIPLDAHLVQDGIIDMDALHVRTRDAVLHLAYLVGKEFSKDKSVETEGDSE